MNSPSVPPIESPFNPLPWIVWVIALPMVAIEILFSAAEAGLIGGAEAVGWRLAAIEQYGVWPAYWRLNWQAGALDFELLLRFFTFPFL